MPRSALSVVKYDFLTEALLTEAPPSDSMLSSPSNASVLCESTGSVSVLASSHDLSVNESTYISPPARPPYILQAAHFSLQSTSESLVFEPHSSDNFVDRLDNPCVTFSEHVQQWQFVEASPSKSTSVAVTVTPAPISS